MVQLESRMRCAVALVLSSVMVAVTATVNYCGARMCGHTNAHTFCQYPEGPSLNCVGYMKSTLSPEEKSRVISRLNRRRNEAAGGKLRGLPGAGNMLKLRWVEELAREAQRWADQCRPPDSPEEHDSCRDLYSIQVGQCVASVIGEAPGLHVESMVDIWYMQSLLYKGNVTFYMPPMGNASYYGDFAQIMWSRSYMVGCGRSRFMTNWNGRIRSVERLVCNIAPRGPPPARPLWAIAAPITLCPSRAVPDTAYPFLCDFQQTRLNITFIDRTMTLEEQIILNTIVEIEKNKAFDYIGSLDEVYLTRLAIVTMENTVATEVYYNSIQKRDIVETINFENSPDNLNHSIFFLNTTTMPNLVKVATEISTTKKNIVLIGRPKSYKIDELSNEIEDPTENDAPLVEIPKDFYAEYEFKETIEDNSTDNSTNINETKVVNSVIGYTEKFTISNENRTSGDNYIKERKVDSKIQLNLNQPDNNLMHRKDSMANTSMIPNVNAKEDLYSVQEKTLSTTTVSMVSSSANINIYTTNSIVNNNETRIVKGNIEDYLSDPETVQELQEALAQMEHSVADTQPERQAKVRRALREYSTEMPLNNQENGESFESPEPTARAVQSQKADDDDRSVMYNMVMKYMPYLQNKGENMGSRTNCIADTIVMVALMFVFV